MIPLSNAVQLAHATTRIVCEKTNGTECGTAFFHEFSNSPTEKIPVIVTNWHVVKDAKCAHIIIADREEGKDIPIIGKYSTVKWEWKQFPWLMHPDPEVDLAVAPLTDLIHLAQANKIRFFYKKTNSTMIPGHDDWINFDIAENILMIGYPNGLWDSRNNMPIIRSGITSTHIGLDYQGKKEFLIDIPCYKGSSGSPVFIHNDFQYVHFSGDKGEIKRGQRTKFIGILYGGPTAPIDGQLFDNDDNPINFKMKLQHFMNLGTCIRSSRINEFLPIVNELIAMGQEPV